jgi:SnoaL-like domain
VSARVLRSGQYGVVDEALATRLRTAFNARDIDTLRSLLAEGATWGEDPNGDSFCRDRNDIIRHLKQLLAEGVRATIVETTTGPRGIAAQIEVQWPEPEDARPNRISFSQVYVVTDGLVTEIHGHDDKDSAIAAISD